MKSDTKQVSPDAWREHALVYHNREDEEKKKEGELSPSLFRLTPYFVSCPELR